VGTAAPYSIQLDHPADMQRRLLIGAFAASATPGAVTPAGGVQATATTCAAGGSPCLTVLHTIAVPLTPSPDVLSASTVNAVDWQGTGAVLAALRIFGNGFE
jgi:hypothetical protein